jgi:hypothetical protein
VGVLDAGRSTLGLGAVAAAAEDPAASDHLSSAIRALVSALDEGCFADGKTVDFSILGVTPAPEDASGLAEALNRVPGGLGCLANAEVAVTTPLFTTLIAELLPLHGRCARADTVAGLYQPCEEDTDCGTDTGRCGRLAYALSEGPRGLSDCAGCGPGTSRSGGACLVCEPGRYSSTPEAATCDTCDPGRYAPLPGSTECLACPPGRHSTEAGAASCTPCEAGTFALPGSWSCTACAAGTFSTEGSATCTACQPGTFADELGATECKFCPKGHQARDEGSTECEACERGTYAPGEGFIQCLKCAPGTFANETGAMECQVCKPGRFAPEGSDTCLPCVAGTFSADGAGSCTACPAGRFAPGEGNTQCQVCPAGTHSTERSAECMPCPKGWTSPPGAVECTPCAVGTYYSTLLTACVACPVGGDCSAPGTTFETLKPLPGYWRSDPGTDTFEPCPSTGCPDGSR